MTSSILRSKTCALLRNVCRHKLPEQIVKNPTKTIQVARNYRSLGHHTDGIRCFPGASNTVQQYCTLKQENSDAAEQNLPEMEFITHINPNAFKSENFKPVKYKDLEFTECLNGFVQVYVKSVGDRHNPASNPNSSYAYGIYFGPNHPLNVVASVTGAKYATGLGDLQASIHIIETLAKIGIKKFCINTSEIDLISRMRRLDELKRLNYIKPQNGRISRYRTELKQIDKLLRANNDLKIVWNFTPENCRIQGLTCAKDLAKTAFNSKSNLKGKSKI